MIRKLRLTRMCDPAVPSFWGVVRAASRITVWLGMPAAILFFAFTVLAQAQPAKAQIPIRVLAQSPADSDTELQIIGLFERTPANTPRGALLEMNQMLKGLLERIRKPGLFRGELGETLLIRPDAGTIRARQLLIVGLGDSQTFTLDRMELVGSIAQREASRIGAAHPFFAPALLDGGMTKYTTGQVSERVVQGFLRAEATEKILKEASGSAGVSIRDLTYLAGPQYAASTREGIEKAIAGSKGRK